MDSKQVLEILQQHEISYQLVEHPAVTTIAEADALDLPFAEHVAKNLFLRDAKNQRYYLAVYPKFKRVPMKELQKYLGASRPTFASEENLASKLQLEPGAVTPLGILNNTDHSVVMLLAKDFIDSGLIAVYPMVNTATLLLKTGDLVELLRNFGTDVRVVA